MVLGKKEFCEYVVGVMRPFSLVLWIKNHYVIKCWYMYLSGQIYQYWIPHCIGRPGLAWGMNFILHLKFNLLPLKLKIYQVHALTEQWAPHLVTDTIQSERWPSYIQWEPQLCKRLEFAPLNPVVDKSCKIESCGNKTYQTIQNMILS